MKSFERQFFKIFSARVLCHIQLREIRAKHLRAINSGRRSTYSPCSPAFDQLFRRYGRCLALTHAHTFTQRCILATSMGPSRRGVSITAFARSHTVATADPAVFEPRGPSRSSRCLHLTALALRPSASSSPLPGWSTIPLGCASEEVPLR